MTRHLWIAAFGLSVLPAGAARADRLLLPPNREITCVIKGETDTHYQIRTKTGDIAIPKNGVLQVLRAPVEENDALVAAWTAAPAALPPTAAPPVTPAPAAPPPAAAQPATRVVTALADPVEQGTVLKVTDRNFRNVVLEADVPVLVDFYATWCGPCKIQAPIVSDLAREYRGKVRFVQVDTDRSPRVSRKYGIRAIPTLILFQDGKVVRRMVGLQRAAALRRHLDKLSL